MKALAIVIAFGALCGVAAADASTEPACGGSTALGTDAISTQPGYFPKPAAGPEAPWEELAIVSGEAASPLIDSPETVRALLQPGFDKAKSEPEPARTEQIARVAASYGYQLLSIDPQKLDKNGQPYIRATLRLAPLPTVRRVDVDVSVSRRSLFEAPVDNEIRRRMVIKTGSHLPWWQDGRTCALREEKDRIEAYLRDEGYYDAEVTIAEPSIHGSGVDVRVEVSLALPYQTGAIDIQDPLIGNDISEAELKDLFTHHRTCIAQLICWNHFSRAVHQQDIQKALDKYHKAGYPAVHITSDFDPSNPRVDHDTRTVGLAIFIERRRKLAVKFIGAGPIPEDQLRAQLTFDKDASSDDLAATESAHAVAKFLQERGYFDARVTLEPRKRIPDETDETGKLREGFDQLVFHIELGPLRQVRRVEFRGNHAMSADKLADVVGTKATTSASELFGNDKFTTAAQLADDVDRIKAAYKHIGYRDARVRPTAATDPSALDSAALAAALVSADKGSSLYVRYDIEEGDPTLLTRLELAIEPDPKLDGKAKDDDRRMLCDLALGAIAKALGDDNLEKRVPSNDASCTATAPKLRFKEDEVVAIAEPIRVAISNHGRPRVTVEKPTWTISEPHRMVVKLDVRHTDTLRVGKVVIRGNFRTRDGVIRDELKLKEGQVLTEQALLDGQRRLRAMGLFDAVSVELPSLCVEGNTERSDTGGEALGCAAAREDVAAIVRVQERYDHKLQFELSGGYSTLAGGLFGTIAPAQRNLFGLGISLAAAFTKGSQITAAEGTLVIPKWLVRSFSPVDFDTEVTAFYREQVTPNFGPLTTKGVTIGLARAFPQPKTDDHPARVFTAGVHYDYRTRERNVDALRPVGIDNDQTQVPVTTRTGSIGVSFDWDERLDRNGGLSSLAPEDGFRLNVNASIAHHVLLGQDDFFKVSATGTRYFPIGDNLTLRTDLRYDEGFPLGNAVLLPEVERFFAGGDNTVRGYEDDRLATELVQYAVPPLMNVSQIRVLPAGGNIRVMGSIDGQVRIWRTSIGDVASGLFMDAGMIANEWGAVTQRDIKPSAGVGVLRLITPFGLGALEYAVPLRPQLGDDPRGRWHVSFAARAQF